MLLPCSLWLLTAATAAPWALDVQTHEVPLFADEVAAVTRAAKRLARREAPDAKGAQLTLRHDCGGANPPDCHDVWRVELSIEQANGTHRALVFEDVETPSQARAWRTALARPTQFPVVQRVSGMTAVTIPPDGWSLAYEGTFRSNQWTAWHRDAPAVPDPFPERVGIDEPATSGPSPTSQLDSPESQQRLTHQATLNTCRDAIGPAKDAQAIVLIDVHRSGAVTRCETEAATEALKACLCTVASEWSFPEGDPHRVLLRVDHRAPRDE